jgi:hypothetical protein
VEKQQQPKAVLATAAHVHVFDEDQHAIITAALADSDAYAKRHGSGAQVAFATHGGAHSRQQSGSSGSNNAAEEEAQSLKFAILALERKFNKAQQEHEREVQQLRSRISSDDREHDHEHHLQLQLQLANAAGGHFPVPPSDENTLQLQAEAHEGVVLALRTTIDALHSDLRKEKQHAHESKEAVARQASEVQRLSGRVQELASEVSELHTRLRHSQEREAQSAQAAQAANKGPSSPSRQMDHHSSSAAGPMSPSSSSSPSLNSNGKLSFVNESVSVASKE